MENVFSSPVTLKHKVSDYSLPRRAAVVFELEKLPLTHSLTPDWSGGGETSPAVTDVSE